MKQLGISIRKLSDCSLAHNGFVLLLFWAIELQKFGSKNILMMIDDKMNIADSSAQYSSNTVFNEDCMTVMARYPDGYFDIATCDIPYGISIGKMAFLKEVKTTVRQKNGTKLNGNRNKKVYTQKEWDKEPPPQSYFEELRRVSKHQIIFGIDYVNLEGVGTGQNKMG